MNDSWLNKIWKMREMRPPWIWSQSSFPTRGELQPQKRKNKTKFGEIKKKQKPQQSRVVFCVCMKVGGSGALKGKPAFLMLHEALSLRYKQVHSLSNWPAPPLSFPFLLLNPHNPKNGNNNMTREVLVCFLRADIGSALLSSRKEANIFGITEEGRKEALPSFLPRPLLFILFFLCMIIRIIRQRIMTLIFFFRSGNEGRRLLYCLLSTWRASLLNRERQTLRHRQTICVSKL